MRIRPYGISSLHPCVACIETPCPGSTGSVKARFFVKRKIVLRGVRDEASSIEYYVRYGNRQVAKRDRYPEAPGRKSTRLLCGVVK